MSVIPFLFVPGGSYRPDEESVSLEFGAGTVWITGSKAGEFCSLFCNHKATLLKADGKDILCVTFEKLEVPTVSINSDSGLGSIARSLMSSGDHTLGGTKAPQRF